MASETNTLNSKNLLLNPSSIWQHKRNRHYYRLIASDVHSIETGHITIIYQSLYKIDKLGLYCIWSRKQEDFLEKFKKVSDKYSVVYNEYLYPLMTEERRNELEQLRNTIVQDSQVESLEDETWEELQLNQPGSGD
jgi:hypothetical protein